MTGRHKAIAFFITLGSVLVAAAVILNVTWIMIHWRRVAPLILGVIFFALIIAGLVVYTVFLVREIRRNEQHDSFINAVTHELKTPIASIRLYLETLQTRAMDDKQRSQFYDVMLADADRLHYTVDQVLKAGIAGQKNSQDLMVSVDMVALVSEAVDVARKRHHLTAAQMACCVPAAPLEAPVLGNAEHLMSAAANLLDNAVKYSRAEVQVVVEVQVSHLEGTVTLLVNDQGVGIHRDEQKAIFDRFYRARGQEAKKVKGTGLGLFIVRSIAKKHGGKVMVESAGVDKGSTFKLELPLYRG